MSQAFNHGTYYGLGPWLHVVCWSMISSQCISACLCVRACVCVCVCVSVDLLTSYESSPITSTTPSLSWVLQRICPGADMAVHFFHLTKSCAGNSSHANDHPFCGVASFELKHLDGSDPGSFHQKYTRISVKCPEMS